MRILITGGSGLLALNWALRCRDDHDVHLTIHNRDIFVRGATTHRVNLEDQLNLNRLLLDLKPDLVIHTAGLTEIEMCEKFPEKSRKANVLLAENIALACVTVGATLVHISTDHLFDGNKAFVEEGADTRPQNSYAHHKAEAEALVLSHKPDAIVIRTSFFGWGPSYRRSFSDVVLDFLDAGEVFTLFDDVFFTALSINRLVDLSMKIINQRVSGIVNICSGERISKYDFGVKLAQVFGYDPAIIQPVQSFRLKSDIVRPLDLSLSNKRMLSLLRMKNFNADDVIQDLKADKFVRKEIGRIGKIIPYGKHYVDAADVAEVSKTLRSGSLTQGPKISSLENRVAEYVGAKFAVCVSSATAGLHLAYMALGIKKEKVVLTSINTFVSTANAAIFCGGNVSFTDIDPKSLNMCLSAVTEALEKDSKIEVVAPVVFGGSSCGISEIAQLAKSYRKFVVEDAAHGLGGSYECGSKIGSCKYSDCTVFSLHPVKSIAAGEGGIITTNSEVVYRQLLRLRSHGINKDDDAFERPDAAYTEGSFNLWYYEMSSIGYHYRMTDIQASLALSQMDKLDKFVARRKQIAHQYVKWMAGKFFIRPAQEVDIDLSANHLFTARIDFKSIGISKNAVMRSLRERGIITQVHYIPVVEHPYYAARGFSLEDYPNMREYFDSGLSLPLYFSMTEEDFDYVTEALSEVLGED